MAMVDQQMRNFVQKFQDLWAGGFSAHLDLDCRGGEAWVGLRLHLGRHRAGGFQQDRGRDGGHRRGASYSRRLGRRAAMRAAGQAAGNNGCETPANTEQAVEVRQEVPAHAVGAGDSGVQVVEVDDTTEKVVEASGDALREVGDDKSAEEALDAEDTTVSFAVAVEMLRKRAREESEEEDSAEEAEDLTVIEKVDGEDDTDDVIEKSTRVEKLEGRLKRADGMGLGTFWECSDCGYRNTTLGDVKRHRQKHGHDVKKWFGCEECDMMCNTESYFAAHMREHHPRVKWAWETLYLSS